MIFLVIKVYQKVLESIYLVLIIMIVLYIAFLKSENYRVVQKEQKQSLRQCHILEKWIHFLIQN